MLGWRKGKDDIVDIPFQIVKRGETKIKGMRAGTNDFGNLLIHAQNIRAERIRGIYCDTVNIQPDGPA